MAVTDSDETYCSEAEFFSKSLSPRVRYICNESSYLRRSQRLSQQNQKMRTEKNAIEEPLSKTSPKKKSQRSLLKQGQNSAQFRKNMEIDACSQSSDKEIVESQAKKQNHEKTDEFNVKKSKISSESMDLISASETLSQELPLNQNQFHYREEESTNYKEKKFENAIDLTIRPNANKSIVLNTIKKNHETSSNNSSNKVGQKRKYDTEKEEATHKATKSNRNPVSKTTAQDGRSETVKSSHMETRKRQPRRTYSPGQFSDEEEKAKPRAKKKRVKDKTKSSSVIGRISKTEKQNLAVIYKDGDIDYSREMIEMNINCPTRHGIYDPPPPLRITKPMPLLKSVSCANSLLPKVYPPHFVNQKPPIETSNIGRNSGEAYYSCPDFTTTSPTAPTPPLYSLLPSNDESQKTMVSQSQSPSTKIKTNRQNDRDALSQKVFNNSGETVNLSNGIEDSGIFYPEIQYSQTDDGRPIPVFSPSLSVSLKGVFSSDDLCEILNVEKIEYRLRETHVKALALALAININELRDIIQNIITIDLSILKKKLAE